MLTPPSLEELKALVDQLLPQLKEAAAAYAQSPCEELRRKNNVIWYKLSVYDLMVLRIYGAALTDWCSDPSYIEKPRTPREPCPYGPFGKRREKLTVEIAISLKQRYGGLEAARKVAFDEERVAETLNDPEAWMDAHDHYGVMGMALAEFTDDCFWQYGITFDWWERQDFIL